MTLQEYLAQTGEKPSAFARRTRLARSTVSRLLHNPDRRPSWETVELIETATKGAVQANDWIRPPQRAA